MSNGSKKKIKIPVYLIILIIFVYIFIKQPHIIGVSTYPLRRNSNQEQTLSKAKNLDCLKTQNFVIYYDSKYINLPSVFIVKDSLEKALPNVLSDFNYNLDKKINVIMYYDESQMSNAVNMQYGNTPMGIEYYGIIYILEPTKWINSKGKGYTYVAGTFEKEGPAVHEITHYVTNCIANGNIPIWLSEGIALYEEYKVNKVEFGNGIQNTAHYSASELENNFESLNQIDSYKETFLIIKYIVDNCNFSTLRVIISELGKGKLLNQVMSETLGMDLNDVITKVYNSTK